MCRWGEIIERIEFDHVPKSCELFYGGELIPLEIEHNMVTLKLPIFLFPHIEFACHIDFGEMEPSPIRVVVSRNKNQFDIEMSAMCLYYRQPH